MEHYQGPRQSEININGLMEKQVTQTITKIKQLNLKNIYLYIQHMDMLERKLQHQSWMK